jgi:hypothetical protein
MFSCVLYMFILYVRVSMHAHVDQYSTHTGKVERTGEGLDSIACHLSCIAYCVSPGPSSLAQASQCLYAKPLSD